MNAPARLLLAVLLCAAGWLLLPETAAASSYCNFGTLSGLSLGTIGGAGGSTNSNFTVACTSWESTPVTFTVCLLIDPNSNMYQGIGPRKMKYNWSADQPNFDLYTSASRSQIIGSTGSGHTAYTQSASVAASSNGNGVSATFTFPVYAYVPAGQSVPSGDYVYQMTPIQKYVVNTGSDNPATAAQCAANGSTQSNYSSITAQGDSGCQIASASDMDFGSVSTLNSAQNQTSVLQLYCPSNTSYTIGLNDGVNADGSTRRMRKSGTSNYINYELYQDSSHTTRWGTAPDARVSGNGTGAVESRSIYGRVPIQTAVPGGDYSDTVTVTVYY